jgi:hypothetical protein
MFEKYSFKPSKLYVYLFVLKSENKLVCNSRCKFDYLRPTRHRILAIQRKLA